jgi:peptide/nickel transport system substrate-binding protein
VKRHAGEHAGRARRARAAILCALLAAGAAVLPSCVKKGSTLHVFWPNDTLSLDPDERFEFATDMVAMNVFEPLLHYDRQGTFAPVLATSWDIADGKTWRFHLKKGVRFQDGTPFGADDVVFTLHRILQSKASELTPYLSAVSSVRKVDDETIEIVSERPANLLSVLSFVYVLPKDSLSKRGDAEFFKHPVGTGPYRIVEWTPNKSLTFEASRFWQGPAPAYSRVELLHFEDREAVWDLAKSGAPAILMSPSRASFEARKDDPAFRLLTRPGMTVQYIACNMLGGDKNPLTKPEVRKALRAALDYPALVQKGSSGQSFPASQYVTADVVGFDPALRVPAFTPGLAKKMLADAGYPNGLDLVMNDTPSSSKLPPILIEQLGAAGIRVKHSVVDGTEFYDRVARCEGDLHLNGWICSTGDASELFEGNFTHRPAPRPGAPTGCGYARPELDAILDRVATTLDPEQRRNLLQQAMRTAVDDLPWIPLAVSYDRYALTGDVALEPRADGELYFAEVRPK